MMNVKGPWVSAVAVLLIVGLVWGIVIGLF